ncbi:hypothetical protein [Haloferula sargassicola]|uniref:Uncharacterized protein n=1 Tax=Haloferula sargassicola TaxID=490096 RepID=A0ABP9UR87_9BACT
MKPLIRLLTVVVALAGAISTAEAHSHPRAHRYVKYRSSCGCPVYYERYVAFYDSCGHPVFRTRTVPVVHQCRPVRVHRHVDRCEPIRRAPVRAAVYARPVVRPLPVRPWRR